MVPNVFLHFILMLFDQSLAHCYSLFSTWLFTESLVQMCEKGRQRNTNSSVIKGKDQIHRTSDATCCGFVSLIIITRVLPFNQAADLLSVLSNDPQFVVSCWEKLPDLITSVWFFFMTWQYKRRFPVLLSYMFKLKTDILVSHVSLRKRQMTFIKIKALQMVIYHLFTGLP